MRRKNKLQIATKSLKKVNQTSKSIKQNKTSNKTSKEHKIQKEVTYITDQKKNNIIRTFRQKTNNNKEKETSVSPVIVVDSLVGF